MKKNRNLYVTLIVALLVVFGCFSILYSKTVFNSDLETKEKNISSNILSRTEFSETYRTSGGQFKTIFYASPVNIKTQNGTYIPFENYVTVTEDTRGMSISTLDGDNFTLKYYEVIGEKKEVYSEKLDKENIKASIEKRKGSIYYNITKDKTKSDEDSFGIDFLGTKDCYDEGDSIICGKLRFDFEEANKKQGFKLTKTDSSIEFSDGDLSFLDPKISYNFNSTNQGIYAINATECDNAATFDETNPPNNLYPSCTSSKVDITSNSALDSSDNSRVTSSFTSSDIYFYFVFNVSISRADITNISALLEGNHNDGDSLNLYWYMFNITASDWKLIDSRTTSSNSDINYIGEVTGNNSASNFNNGSVYLLWTSNAVGARNLAVDYVQLTVSYDGLAVNSPTNNFINNTGLGAILNTSQAGYNNTVWYTWNNGIANYTLCTNSNECRTPITFPRNDSYNLTVYANNSDNTITSQTVTNISIGTLANIKPTVTNLTANNTLFGSLINNQISYNVTDDDDYIFNTSIYVWNSTSSLIWNRTTSFPSLSVLNNFLVNVSKDGIYTYQINATDSDNTINATNILTFRVDTNDPQVNILYPINNTNISTATIDINYSIFDSDGNIDPTSCKWSKDGGITNTSLTTCQNITSQTFPQGLSTVNIWVSDLASNEALNITTFRVDTLAPSLSIVSPTNFQSFNTNIISVNYTVLDSGVGLQSCWYRNNTDAQNISVTCGTNFTVNQALDGSYIVYVWSNDSLGNIASDSKSYTISTTAPAISLIYPQNNQWFSSGSNIEFNITASDTDGIDRCSLYGNWTGIWHLNQSKTFAGDTSINVSEGNFSKLNLPDGYYQWNSNCNDTLNTQNWGSSNFTFGVDSIFPSISISYPQNTSYTTTTLSFNFTVIDINRDSCWYSNNSGLNNYTLTNCANTTYIASQGSTTLILYANDSANNINSTSVTFYVDSIFPTLNITYPQNNSNISSNSISINYSFVENNPQKCKWTRNAGVTNTTLASCGTNITGQTWNENLNNVTIFINDTLGNENSSSVSFIVDTVYPILDIVTPLLITQGSQTVKFNHTASDTYLRSCKYSVFDSLGIIDGSLENVSVACNTNDTQFVVSAFGNYNLTLYALDYAGNENSTNISFSVVASGSPTGGGGIIPQSLFLTQISAILSENISLSTPSFGSSLDFILAKDSVRARGKSFILVNKNKEPIKISLTCDTTELDINLTKGARNDINICEYVSFDETEIDVSENEEVPSIATVFIKTPINSSFGDKYAFNIIALKGNVNDTSSEYAKLSVSARVPIWGLVYKFSYIPFQKADKLEKSSYPTFLVAFGTALLLSTGVLILSRKRFLLTGFIISTILFFTVLFILSLYL